MKESKERILIINSKSRDLKSNGWMLIIRLIKTERDANLRAKTKIMYLPSFTSVLIQFSNGGGRLFLVQTLYSKTIRATIQVSRGEKCNHSLCTCSRELVEELVETKDEDKTAEPRDSDEKAVRDVTDNKVEQPIYQRKE
jgi:uncharacterized protein with PIN domain